VLFGDGVERWVGEVRSLVLQKKLANILVEISEFPIGALG
jgi:hypothetical protein